MEAILHTGATKADLAWAAGLFEGEGCFTLVKGKVPNCVIGMTDRDVIDRFMSLFGFGSIHVRKKKAPLKDQYVWTIGGYKTSQAFIALIWPWLGERRKARAEEILETCKREVPNGKRKHFCKRGHSLLDESNVYLRTIPGRERKIRVCLACGRHRHATTYGPQRKLKRVDKTQSNHEVTA